MSDTRLLSVALAVAVHAGSGISALAATADVARTPQMGWNSWNKFACNISEDLIKETTEALLATGLSDLGYKYVNLDDCWQGAARDKHGLISADAQRFPSGLQSLGDYVHDQGMLFGVYSSAGFKTCEGYPASLGVEEADAASYVAWGVDYLKYDNCYQDHGDPHYRYGAMATALRDAAASAGSERAIFYSLCEWGRENPAAWAPGIGAQSWRISPDIKDSWQSIVSRANIGSSLWRYAGKAGVQQGANTHRGLFIEEHDGIPLGGWNDPDMLEVGNGHCSLEEYKSHFSLWAMLKAPLLIGNDVRELVSVARNAKEGREAQREEREGEEVSKYPQTGIDWARDLPEDADPEEYAAAVLEILSNEEVIAVNQDKLGVQARLVWSDTSDALAAAAELAFGDKLIATKCASASKTEAGAGGKRASTAAYTVTQDKLEDQQWVYDSAEGTIESRSTGKCLHELDLTSTSALQEKFTAKLFPSNAYTKRDANYGKDALRSEMLVYPFFMHDGVPSRGAVSSQRKREGLIESEEEDASSGGRLLLPRTHSVTTADCNTATRWTVGGDEYVGGSVVSLSTGNCLEVAKFEFLPEIQGKRVQTGVCHSIIDTVEDPIIGKTEVLDFREHQSWAFPFGSFTEEGEDDDRKEALGLGPNGILRSLYQRQCLTVDRDAFPGVRKEVWMSYLAADPAAHSIREGEGEAALSIAVMLFNKGATEEVISFDLTMLGLVDEQGALRVVTEPPRLSAVHTDLSIEDTEDRAMDTEAGKLGQGQRPVAYSARDLWKHEDLRVGLSSAHPAMHIPVPSHSVVLLKLSPRFA